MYELTIRKTCKALNALQAMQKAYGYIIDYSYKTIVRVYGFDAMEIPVLEEYITIRKVVLINE